MTPELYQQIGQIYHAALELEPEHCTAFLDKACAGDAALRGKVDALLAAHRPTDDFMERPALEVVTRVLAERQNIAAVGQNIGHYRVLSLLGRGGMGEVYRARDTRLGREVAIKVLPVAFSLVPDRLRRFEQEAMKSMCGPTLVLPESSKFQLEAAKRWPGPMTVGSYFIGTGRSGWRSPSGPSLNSAPKRLG